MRKWKVLFVNSCIQNSPISTATEILTPFQGETVYHYGRGLCRKVRIPQWNLRATFNFSMTGHLIIMT